MKIHTTFLLFIIALISCTGPQDASVEKWDVYEIVLEGPLDGNPFMDVELSAIFRQGDQEIEVPGFYDGEGIYRIRFSPASTGSWDYSVISSSDLLDGRSGSFTCIAPGPDNHGPLEIAGTFNLQYADGTPFYAIGTTAYQWTSVAQHIQDQTVESLKNSPFNKIRMCVFPKYYRYGNESEPWRHAFPIDSISGDEPLPDFSSPDYVFFRNFDRRVEELRELGIQADVILFHPYDNWGYASIGKEMQHKYVRYMMARLSAYRNLWWSLANEWDIPGFKEQIDWEGIGTILQHEDPHQRFRGIHNWYDSEDHFYDHGRPWITHTSAQTSWFHQAIEWRERYQKPLMFDEMRYEGDVPSGWGNLTGETMAAFFWMAGLSGAYPTHGETLVNTADDSTEVRWWGKGGKLMGKSPERIAYFRSLMEEAPFNEMHPEAVQGDDPKDRMNCVYLLAKAGAYYLAYCPSPGLTVRIGLPGSGNYDVELLDTWNMQTDSTWKVGPGAFEFTPDKAYSALRIRALDD